MSNYRIIGLLSITAVVLAARPTVAAETPYVQQMNVVFDEVHGIGLLMDIFTPTGDKNGLGLIDVASGAWHSDRGKIRDHKRGRIFDIMCKKGYTVFAVRPGSVTKFSAPEMLHNLNQGIKWVKAHAEEYGIDPNRLGMTGASAGGHLASLAAVTADDETHVHAVAVFFPPTDFLDYGGKSVDARSNERWGFIARRLAFPGGVDELSDEDISEKLTQISPARLANSDAPPFLVIHGDADPVVPLQQSQRLVEELEKAGVAAQLIIKQGGGHPWLTIHEEVAVMSDWFDQQLKPAKDSPAAASQ